jgi:hypothetical protein
MSGELAVIAGSSVAGALSAAIIERLSRARQRARAEQRTATAAKIEHASLLFEKTLVSESITRVYEAAQAGRIDALERDRLLAKYKHEIDSLNERIASVKPVAEYEDLAGMRNELVSLLENRISALDRKLAEMSKAGVRPAAEKVRAPPEKQVPAPEKVEVPEPKAEPEKREPSAEEKSIEQLQKEIMQALQRLEQVEMDKD